MEKIVTPPERRYDLDWLRVLAMLNIFLFHAARLFNYEDWHVKNNQTSFGPNLFVDIVCKYIMPLFFIISAISSFYSLDRRSAGKFLRERFQRLMVPFIFGVLVVIAPVQVWIERRTHPPFYPGSFVNFMLHDYFHGFYLFGGNFAWIGIHLWYLLILFLYSLIALPLLLAMLRPRPRRIFLRLGRFTSRPGAIFIYILPLFIVEFLVNLQPDGIGMTNAGGWSLPSYLVIFLMGFVLALDPAFRLALVRHRTAALAAAAVLTVIDLTWESPGLLPPMPEPLHYLLAIALRASQCWSFLVAILGFGFQHLNFTNGFLRYANRAVLPFYILHQTVIVVMGYYLRDWDAGVAVKYLLVCTVGFGLIMAIYEFGVKRLRVLRFLFGMKG